MKNKRKSQINFVFLKFLSPDCQSESKWISYSPVKLFLAEYQVQNEGDVFTVYLFTNFHLYGQNNSAGVNNSLFDEILLYTILYTYVNKS